MPTLARPILPPLRTPQTASFPSEIVETPLSCVSAIIKQEQGLKTPITPPMAYTEFLKALTPILASPPPTALTRSMSDESTATRDSLITSTTTSSTLSSLGSGKNESRSQSAGSTPTSAHHRRPINLKRLRIPGSPAISTTSGLTPRTGMSTYSVLSPAMNSATMLYSPFSPADWNIDSATRRYFDSPRSACKPVCVRSVVTRTVTYRRSPPLDPAPKGKKRKYEGEDMPPPPAKVPAMSTSSMPTPVPVTATTTEVA